MSGLDLQGVKRDIPLPAFAASYGYALDARETSRNSAVMRHVNGDKIIVAKSAHGHWVYFSVRDDADNGTIIDFIQHRKPGATLGHVRRELAAWSGAASVPRFDLPDLKPVSKDRAGVMRNWACMAEVASHAYLEARGIPAALLASDRFRGTFRVDARGNVAFAHRDEDGVCGYELKNRGFTGFATGGVKALWLTNRIGAELVLVVAESAIDALSYAALHPGLEAVSASTAGGWSDVTRYMLRITVSALPAEGRLLLAFGQDAQGRRFLDQACALLGNLDRELVAHLPSHEGMDWNDVLRDATASQR